MLEVAEAAVPQPRVEDGGAEHRRQHEVLAHTVRERCNHSNARKDRLNVCSAKRLLEEWVDKHIDMRS